MNRTHLGLESSLRSPLAEGADGLLCPYCLGALEAEICMHLTESRAEAPLHRHPQLGLLGCSTSIPDDEHGAAQMLTCQVTRTRRHVGTR